MTRFRFSARARSSSVRRFFTCFSLEPIGGLGSPLWHHRWVTSSGLEHLARTAYEAHRGAHPADLPPWEETTGQERQAWRAAVSAVAAQTGTTLIEKASPARALVLQIGRAHV